MRDEIMIATTADHPVMAFAKPCESEPEQMWIDLKDTAPFEYILGPPSTVLGRTGRRSLREAGVEPLGLDTYLSASFAAAMAREGVGLAGGDGAREAVSGDGAGAAEAVSFFTPTLPAAPQRKYPSRHVSAVFHELHRAALQYI